MANITYTVQKGDTLSEIAVAYNTSVVNLMKLNPSIVDEDLIYVGQTLVVSGTPAQETGANNTWKATITHFGLQSNTDRTVYAKWNWSQSNTDHYKVRWWYATGDGVGIVGSDSTTEFTHATYSAPENATHVSFYVQPVSKTYTKNDKETHYWTAQWSTVEKYYFKDNPPSKPGTPDVEIKDFTLTAELDNIASDINAKEIQFQVVKDDSTVFKTGNSKIVTNHASFSCKVTAGSEYKVRCRAVRDKKYSDWSEYSANKTTIPAAPAGFTTCKASSETSVTLAWAAVKNAESYDIEYATKKEYFEGSNQTTTQDNIKHLQYELTGLETGQEYFFRLRAVNKEGESAWSGIKSVVLGKEPVAPTTWSSTTTAIVGEPLTLYWVHNAEDGSSQTYAELEITVAGTTETYTIKNSEDEDEKDKTSFYEFDTTDYPEGTKVEWRVRTAGITKAYGDWSISRVINIYAPATLELNVTDVDGNALETLTTFPAYISALAGPNTQVPIGYHLVVTSNEIYETVDNIGNVKMVNAGEQIYSKYFDISDPLVVELSASNINLDNNISYTITCTVTMDSGLTATATSDFTVAWTDEQYWPNAELTIDNETYAAYIRPYCLDENDVPIEDLLMSVYRREFDGSFTELMTGIDQTKNTFITDPHPSLDYARYRIVATSKSTGAVSFYDMPGYPIGCVSVVIQWDEEWSIFDAVEDETLEQPAWAGSLLQIPYNIDVSDKHQADASLVEYIGREHPVSYYGTQVGHTSSWSFEFPKSDKETLYAIRRLARWTGDVYVREPSGSGYWANITVSYNQKHRGLTIPVSMDVTRVEGGV